MADWNDILGQNLSDQFSVEAGGPKKMNGEGINPTPPPAPTPLAPPPLNQTTVGSPVTPATLRKSHPDVTETRPAGTAQPAIQPQTNNYFNALKDQLARFGPDKQLQTEQALMKGMNGPGMAVAKGGAAFADALMQGVARAGNPEFLKRMQENNEAKQATVEHLAERLGTQNIEQIKMQHQMDMMNPDSVLGKEMLSTWKPILDKMGIPKETQSRMMPTLIEGMAKPMSELLLKEAEIDAAWKRTIMEGEAGVGARATTILQPYREKDQTLKALEDSLRSGSPGGVSKTQLEKAGLAPTGPSGWLDIHFAPERLLATVRQARQANLQAGNSAVTQELGTNPFARGTEGQITAKYGLKEGEGGQAPSISSQEAYDALPKGAKYLYNGEMHQKS